MNTEELNKPRTCPDCGGSLEVMFGDVPTSLWIIGCIGVGLMFNNSLGNTSQLYPTGTYNESASAAATRFAVNLYSLIYVAIGLIMVIVCVVKYKRTGLQNLRKEKPEDYGIRMVKATLVAIVVVLAAAFFAVFNSLMLADV